MSHTIQTEVGSVVSLWQYPVKSMMGEELNASEVTDRGLLGDRAYALVDSADGKVATAKNPRKWPRLFDFRATFIEPPRATAKVPSVRIALPDGATVTSDQSDLNQILSKALDREVTLGAARRGAVNAEEDWPDMEGLDHRDTGTDFTLPEETFFDCAMIHLADSVVEGAPPRCARKPGYVAAFIRAYYARRAGDVSVVLPDTEARHWPSAEAP